MELQNTVKFANRSHLTQKQCTSEENGFLYN